MDKLCRHLRIWRDCRSINGDAVIKTRGGLDSLTVLEQYAYYRLNVTTSVSVTYTAFMVDGSVDELVMLKTCELAYLPHIGDDTIAERYIEMRNLYNESISALAADYDSDGDGEIDTDEQNTTPRQTAYR